MPLVQSEIKGSFWVLLEGGVHGFWAHFGIRVRGNTDTDLTTLTGRNRRDKNTIPRKLEMDGQSPLVCALHPPSSEQALGISQGLCPACKVQGM